MTGARRTAREAGDVSTADLLGFYREMWLIRRFEERTTDLFLERKIWGSAHSYIGQEAIAVGVASALSPEDRIAGNHRSHGHVISRGADIRLMMAELMGKD